MYNLVMDKLQHKWRNQTLIGQRFGRLYIVSLKGSTKHGRLWSCLCDCGKTTHVTTGRLSNGNTSSCGCLQRETVYPDLIGRVFGKLKVVESAGIRKQYSIWKCSCTCGGEKYARTNDLYTGRVRSCGCLRPGYWKNGHNLLQPGDAVRNTIIRAYKDNAKKHGFVWGLSLDEAIKLFSSNCYYCNCPPSRTRTRQNRKGSFTYNGLDRKDNAIGYVINNVVPCCTVCNFKKGSTSHDDFISWIKSIAANLS